MVSFQSQFSYFKIFLKMSYEQRVTDVLANPSESALVRLIKE